jgi:hypothetical protein
MKFLQIFNLKKDFIYLRDSGKLDELKHYIEAQIIYYAKKELAGSQKKDLVINLVNGFIIRSIIPINGIIGSILMTLAPSVVQYLYDSLVKFVDGLTVKI